VTLRCFEPLGQPPEAGDIAPPSEQSLRPAQPSADAAISSIPDYMRLNPSAVVPTLIHDGRIIIESTVIMHFVSTTCSVVRR
jgi:Glutathione S-transferase, N-terminal domain